MPDAQQNRHIEFFRGFLRNPKEVGSVIPSSRFLIRRVLQCGRVQQARTVVELGPGTGVLTREILRSMPVDGRLIGVEISSDFAAILEAEFPDPRLRVFRGSATELERALDENGAGKADLVVSGIPFSNMGSGDGRLTLEAAKRVLAPGGRFVAYQFRDHVRRMAEPVFGQGETVSGFWNIPPMRIYTWARSDA